MPRPLADAIVFWELGRLGYNGVLAALLFAFVVATDSWTVVARSFGMVVALGAVANVLYCAAYPIDLIAQATPARTFWLRWRWLAWGLGTAFASLLAFVALFGLAPYRP